MRRLLRYLLIGMAALAASGGALAQSVTVLDYQFGTTSTPVFTPTTRHNNVVPGDPLMLIGNQMTSVPKFNTGGNTTGFMEYNNWPTSESGAGSWATSTRTSLAPSITGTTLWTRFTMGPNSSFSLANATLQFRYQRPSTTSPKDVRACLTWYDGTTYRRRYSATTNLATTTSTTTWQTAFNVRIGGTGSAGDTLPTGTAMSGKTFLLEVQFFNCSSASNKINIDDVKFLADSAVTGSIGWITPASLPGGNVGVPYFQRLQAGSGNVASYTYSVVSGSLPAGLTLTSGNIVGTPTTAGTSTFTARAAGSTTVDRAFTLVVSAAPTAASGATLASWNFDADSGADTLAGPNTMSACLSEVTWGFDEKGTLSNSIHAEGTAAGSGNPVSVTRTANGKMRCFTGWEVGDNYTATRNSLLHVTDPSSSSGNWRFAVSPSANTGSIPPAAYVTTGESNVLQYSMTFRQTATGTLRSFKADLLRWLKDDMVNDGYLGPRYVRLYAYYTNDAGVVQRWTGSTIDINAIYYQALQTANISQFRNFWWDLSTLHTAINATTAKYGNRKIAFELYFYHEHGYDAYQIPVVLIDNVGIQGDFTCPTVSIGNLVWDDLDNDGIKDSGESGLAGAQVELFSPGADNAIGGTGGNADTKIGSTITTTATGAYNFTGLDPGNYYVKVTPPSTHVLTGGVPDAVDNAEDNDNNGAQPGGRGTPLFSPVINLAIDAESITDGDTDNDTNYTVDFGVFRGLCVGNLVYIDRDDNGSFNSGDTGAGGVTVQLYNTSNTLVASTTTSNGTLMTGFQVQEVYSSTAVRNYTQAMAAINGTNSSSLWTGSASQINYLYPGDTDGRFTSGNVNFPNDINPYSPGDFVVRATGIITIPTTGTYTFGMTLDDGGRLRVNNTDVIVDESGLHSKLDKFGQITLNAGTYPIEMIYMGVWGGAVELYAQSGSHTSWNSGFKLIGNTASGGLAVSYNDPSSGGRWQIDGVAPGSYYVKIPASEFLTGKPLNDLKSIKNGTPAYSVIDDDGAATGSDNGTDTPTPSASGVRTTSFQLAAGTEPTNAAGETGTGGTSDDTRDADVDLTVDLGFHTEQEGCFYMRLIDTDRDGVPLIQRLNGTTLSTNLVFGGSIANIDRAQFAYDTRTQRLDVQYIFNQWSGKKVEGFYFVLTDGPTPNYDNSAAIMYVDVFNRSTPKVTVMKYQGPEGGQTSYLTPGQLLDGNISRPAFCTTSVVEAGASLTVTISADMSRVNNGNLWTSYGINPATWGGMSIGKFMGIWSHYYDLASAPTYNAEGKLTSWPRNNPDSSWWNYMDSYNSEALPTESPCGAIMTIGNMVFNDANSDGNFDAGEGVDNVLVYLFPEGRNALTDTPAAAVLTTGGGQYAFTGLTAGRYFVHIPPSEFQSGGPLFGKVSIPGAGGDAVADDNVDENGIDAAFPAALGISTGTIVLTDNGEPVDTASEAGANATSDNADDNNGDLTVDLGFRSGANLTLGDLVWFDSNNNGTKQPSESGIPNIQVDLFTPGADNAIGGSGSNADTLVASTTTSGSGTYSFAIPSPGRYFVRVTPSSTYPATGSSVVTTDDGNDGDNNGSQPGGEYSFIYSPVITLTDNGEPGSSGSTDIENTIDFGLSTSRKLSVGNLVYLDNNNNGRYDAGDGGVGGVRVQLFNASNVLLQETTTVSPPFLPGWSLKQAKASIEVKSVATAEAVMLGTSRTSLWTGSTDFINYVTTTSNNDWTDWGNAGDGKLLPNGSMENVVLQATATLNITTGDTYTFCINTDDGGRLKVDGSLLIHDDGLHGPEDRFGSLVLAAGKHSIEFLGFEWVGGGGFEVWAKRGSQDWFDDDFRLVGDTANGGLSVTYPGAASDTGRYRFNNIDPGSYYVKIPNTEFGAGGPLEGRLSFVQTTAPTDDQKDDNSTTGSADSGVDATKPALTGISSHTFALAAGGEPTGATEGGFMGSEDDAADNNGDMTIDFALDGTKQVVAGCYRFNMKDLNKDCNFSAVEEISPDQPYDFGYSNGQNGVFFYFTDWDMIFDADKDRLSIDVTYEQVNGKKVDAFWICVTPGPAPHTDNSAIIYFDGTNRASPKITIYKYTTSLGESSWQTTGNCMVATSGTGINASDVLSMSVVETGVSVRFKATINTARINNANNWSFVTNKSSWVGSKFYSRAGIWFHPMDVSPAWTYNANGSIATTDDMGWPDQGWLDTSEDGSYSVMTELCPTLTVGDLVWQDDDNDGQKDATETGVDNVLVQLWTPGVNGTRENGGGDDQFIADTLSFNGGFYQFQDVLAGVYYVRIPNPPAGLPLASGTVTTTDNSVNNDNNGSQPGGGGTQIVSPLFTLTVGLEPSGAGSNEDTIDFGLRGVTTDFGDWAGSGAATSTTSTTINANLRLGTLSDGESSVVANSTATTDDTTGTDDEDGVTMPALITEGDYVTIPASVFNNSGANAYLSAWIDFNNDGTFNNTLYNAATATTGELLVTPVTVGTNASIQALNLSFPVPPDTSPGANRGVRFRLANSTGIAPTGAGSTGEIEDYVLRICPRDMIAPEALAQGLVGTAFSQTFTTTGATTPVVWSAGGSLPPGITFNTSTAVLSGTPTTAGTYQFKINATDAAGCVDGNLYTMIVTNGSGTVCNDVQSTALSNGRRWGYVATGPPYEPGLSIRAPFSNYGVLAGTSMRLQDAGTGGIAGISYKSWCVTSASRTTPSWGGSGRIFRDTHVGVPSGTIAVNSPECSAYACWAPNFGSGYQFTLTLTPAQTSTPAGIYWESVYYNPTFSEVLVNGVQVATNIGPVATGQVQIDAAGATVPNYYYFVPFTTAMNAGTAYTITLRAPAGLDPVMGDFAVLGCCSCATVTVNPASLSNGNLGLAYAQTISATGGVAPYTYSVTSGSLPSGLALNASTGVLNGTPTAVTTATFTVTAADANGCSGSRAYSITISPSMDYGDWSHATNPSGAATTTTTSTANATLRLGEFVDAEASVSPNSAATTDDITGAQDDEDGVTVPASITQGGGATVTARVLNTSGANGYLHAWIDFNNDGVFNNTIYTTAGGERLEAVRTIANGTGTTTAQNITFTVPANASPGAQRGVRVRFTNQSATTPTGASGTGEIEDYVVTIACSAITVNPTSLANGTVGTAYSQTFTSSGGTAPYTYALTSGTLPAGLTLSTAGVLSGTPTASNGAGASLTITATDSLGCTGTRTVTLKVCPVLSLSDLGGSAVVGRTFSQTVTASGGAAAYTYAITSGSLPAGLSLATSTGIISGTPTTAGTSSFTITATDANACAGSKAYSIQTHATLLEWNTEDSTSGGTVSMPSFVHGCIFGTNGLNHSDNGTILSTASSVLNGIAMTGVRARSTTGWDNTDTFTLPRPNDGFNDRVLSCSFAFENLLTLNWGNLSMDVRRPATNSPTKYRAALIWFQGSYPYSSGVSPPASAVKTAWTNTFTVSTTNTWTTLNMAFTNFSSGITALPAFNEVANEKMVLVVHAWDGASGGAVGALEYDNVILGGSATCGAALSIGDTVFADLNGNNTYESTTDSGIGNLAVELLTAAGTSFTPPVTTTTNASGVYNFTGLPAGSYKVKVTPGTSYPLAVTAVNADNGVNNDSNGIQAAQGAAAISPAITLANGTEPGSTGTGNAETTIDFGFKTCPPITVSPTTLGSATVGTAYSQTISGSGGVGPYTFSVTSGTLPAGLTLNTSSGAITGTPTSSTSQSFTVQITDLYGCTGTRAYTVTPACPAITVNPLLLPAATVGVAYSQTLTATGGTAAYTFAVSAGTLPAGLTLSTAGVLSGTPTTANGAGVSVTIRATDLYGCQGTRVYALKVCPVVTVSPTSLANGTVGTAYSQTLSASGGVAAYTYAVTSGSLPTGLSLNTSTGVVSGTPTVAGSSTVTVTATDANGCPGSRAYTVTMSCPAITVSPTSLANGTIGLAYPSTTFTATGGTGTYTYTVSAGTLPAGLTLTTAGVLSGTPTASNGAGVSITVQAKDSNNCTGTRAYTLKICPVVTVNPTSLANGTVGTAYSQTVSATGGATPYTFAVASGSLPAGLTLNASTGVISGTPTSTTAQTFTLRATDANACTGTRAYTVTPVCPTITIAPTSLANATLGIAYSQTLTGSGGTSPYTWSVTSGSLPAGLTLNATSGVISGTPTASNGAGTSVTFRAQDAYGCAATRAITVRVCPTITTTPTTLANGTVGLAYSQTFAASGGATPYTYAVASGTLPAGLSLNATTGVVSGTPTSTTAQTFTLSATDVNTCVVTRSYTVTPVCPAITVNPTTLTAPTTGVAYSATVSATGGTAPHTFAISAGSLPAGLSLNATTGVISGTTNSTAATSFTVRATDVYGCTGTRAYAVTPVCPTITVSPASVPNAYVGIAYSQTFTAAGGTAGYTFNVSAGTLPAGLSLSTAGVLSGTPTTANGAGVNVTVRAVDANGCAGTRAVTIRVCPTINTTPTALANGTVGLAYSQTFAASGGVTPYTYAVSSGTLPTGLSLNATTGVISGTPTSTTAQTFVLSATDANTCVGTRSYTVTPVCPTITVNPTSLTNGVVGTAYSQTVSATGGTAPYTFAVSAGTLPAGLTLNATTGVISGTPTSTTAQTFTMRATDTYGCTGTRAYTVTPACPAITVNPLLLPAATVGVAYSQTLTATGGTAAYTFAVSAGTLPAGLTLSTAGVLSGTPTTANGAGVSVTIRATDLYGCQGTRVYALKVCPVVTVSPTSLANGTVGTAYSQTLSASGGVAAYTYAVTSGSLPTGLSLNTSTGVVSGTPTVAGSSTVTVTATDANGCPGSQAYTMTMSCPAITVNPTSLANGTIGLAYPSTTFTATGGTGTYTYTVVAGSLPAGLTLTTAGVLSGTPTASNGAGVSITVQARDSNNCAGTRAYNLKICPVVNLSPTTLATATVTQAYSQTIVASGGATPYTFAVASGSLPAGLTLNTSTGVISGTPTALTAATFTLRATDVNGCTGTRAYTLTPVCPTITLSPATLPNGTVGTAYSQTLSATGGTGAKTFAVTTGTLPAGLTLSTAGVLSGTPTSIATQTFTVTATDTLGCTGALSYTITPNPNTDWGDFSAFGTASNTLNSNLRLGALVDVEGVAPTDANATGDDLSGSDDEDGVTFPSMTAGQPVTVPVTVTNNTGTVAYLNVWMDFNDNGVLTDAGEQIANNVSIPNGSTDLVQNVSFTLPPSTVTTSTIGVRARLTFAATPGPTGSGSAGEVEDYAVTVLNPTTDFGDWSGAADAVNTANSNLRMGALVDAEYTATKNATATGDDTTGNDDEDGVTIPALTAGGPATISVIVTNSTGANAYLNAWIDFNNNGSFADAGEQIFTNITITTGAANSLQNLGITVPPAALTGTALGARFRLTSATSPGPTGIGGVGEIEDYVVTIAQPTTDFGDYASFASASSTRNANLRLGATIDTEFTATTNAAATGDDTTGTDDEDGVTLPTMTAGAPATIPVVVTNNTGAAAYLNAWIDYNGNNSIADAGEQIATNVSVVTGTTNGTLNLNVTVPATALTGVSLGVRVRLTSTLTPGVSGASGNGEVEDYKIIIAAPTTDFGDFSGFADASQGANASLYMGTGIDTEFVATKNATATGDDTTGTDDEDGATIPSVTAGQTVTVPVTVTNNTGANAYLNAWVDFNNNNNPADTGEQFASNVSVPTGTTNGVVNLSLTVPANAVTGTNLGVRFRLSAPNGLGPTGANSLAGEVEDYVVNVLAPTTDFGDHSGYADASSTVVSTIRLGATTDKEFAATKNAVATGDDTTGTDDEDAVTFPTLTAGAPATIPVIVTNSTGVAVNLNAWIDYNNNGSFADAGEQIATNTGVATGTTNGTLNLGITVPAAAVTGLPLGVRVRLTSTASPGSTGASGNGEVEDYIVTIASPTTDFGDWNRVADASNGASTSLRLGATVDTEFVSTRNATATGDDITGSDDEDGVTFPSLVAGGTFTVPVTVTNITGAGAFLNAWIDFNNNGVLTDAGEQVAVNTAVVTGSTNSILNVSVPVPVAAVTGTALGARFRLTSVATPGATGSGGGTGEVEDYVVTITQPTTDFGDHSALGSASSTVNTNLRLGALTDVEYLATLNSSATGDDITGSDDEDAVTMPALTAGGPATIPVLVTNNTGTAAYLNAWIDYNGNGVLTDAGEQIATNTAVVTGTTNGTLNLSITVPATATQGAALPVRYRLTNVQNPGSTGFSGSGEVEDYTVTIATPPSDFGDFSGFASAFSTRNAAIKIGATTDTEFAATSNALATGDDTTGSDDEDGVTVPSMTAGAPATLVVNVTNSSGAVAYLNAWIDFNNNGVITDAGEQIATNTNIATGTNAVAQNIAFTVPATAVTGTNLGIRVRLTSTITPGPTGGSGSGEVEDNVANIAVPTTDFGDWNGAADASSTASSNLRMGPLVDTEYVSTRNGTATGDDTTASDDEDGVTLPALTPGTSSNATVTVTNLSGAAAYLNAWIDFNNNGSFADAGEQVATNVSIVTGTNAVAQSISITTPLAAVPGQRGARFRFTSTQNPGATGASGTGEVEDYLVTVNCLPVTVNPTSVANGLVGTAYSQTLTGSGGMAPYSFAVTAGTLPAGLTLSTAGAISGTPTVSNGAGTSVTIRATDAYGCSGTRAYTIKICPVISLAALNSTLTIGSAYSSSAAASGGTAPYTYAVTSGTLPTGLTLNTTTGAVTGTPTVTTSQTFTINATDANACVGTRSFTLAPACPTITLTPTTLPNAFLNTAYSQIFSASGGTSPYTYAVTSGTLPAGITLSTAGVLSGTPTTAGSATVTIRATDNYGCTGSASVTITVRGLIIGDMIFNDANNNGLLDGGETGISGATVQLWNPGADNVIGGASADTQVGSNFTTTSTGLYSFANLTPGNYYVKVTLPAPFNMTGGTPATTDDNVNNNNDGSQPGGVGTPLFSPVVTLAVGTESTTDGDTDSSSNMTIDFGAYAGICVGNLVFKDVNNNGSYQAGTDTVLAGVELRIFSSSITDPLTSTPLYSTTSNASGIYQFCVPAGSYYIHVPPSQFATSAVLDNHIPAIGPTDSTVTPVDDNLDQNVLMAFKPGFTGVNTGIFTLALNTEPTNATGETGTSNTSDDSADSNTDLTVDLGFYPLPPPGTALGTSNTSSNNLSASGTSSSNLLAAPVTYAAWLQSNAGEDGDLYPKLLEYALGTDPASGASGAGAVRLENSASHADFVFTRPAGGRSDVRYELEASTDGIKWTRLTLVPVMSIGTDGRQIVRYASVDQAAAFAGSNRGLLRLKAGLDGDLDGTFEETAASPVLMFSREVFPAGVQRTFSMPLVQNELFAGSVSVSDDRITLPQAVKLPASKQLYVEDLTTGQAYEVDEAASTSTRLVLESAMTARTARIALRAHHTLAGLLPENAFTAGEDRVISFDAAANDFIVTTLADTGWLRDGQSASADLVTPQAAMLVHARSSEVSLLFTGQVTKKPAMAASRVTRFIGSGSILPESPASLGLSSENGFRSSETATEAARLRFWKADTDASQTGYENLYLAPDMWTRQNTLVTEDLTDAKLFEPFRGFFILP